MTLQSIIRRCQDLEIGGIAITDHNTIAGALEMKRIAHFPVIIGEEIRTTNGEIIGLFLSEEIPRGLSPEETVTRIKSQGGLVCIPHPFDTLRRHSGISSTNLARIQKHIDIVEVFNARTLLRRDSTRAIAFAQSNGFLSSAGSDAHMPAELGYAYVEMPEFEGRDEFRAALAQGQVFGHSSLSDPRVLFTLFTGPVDKFVTWLKKRGKGV